jgi:glycosyltransferase involved in cell wall biosynthesis
MRIWAFPSFYPYNSPGMTYSGIFAHRQYKGLIESGADLKVIVPVAWKPVFPFSLLHPEWKEAQRLSFPEKRVYDGVTVYHPRYANTKPSRLTKKTYEERYVESIVGFFKKNNITLDRKTDIFYSQWLPSSVFVQKAAHQLGVKSAILGIGDDIIVWPRSRDDHFRSFKQLLANADLRIVNADYLGREMNEVAGQKLPYKVVFFGVDYTKFKPVTEESKEQVKREYKLPAGKVIILIIGSALRRKGWLDLFDALSEVKLQNDNFLLVGGHAGQGDFDMMTEVEKRGLTGNFFNLGEVKPEHLSKTYNAADIFCLPSHWEGLATVISEAMASGLPVITTDMCGHPEIIENGVTGILVPPKQPHVLAEALLELISHKTKRDRLGENARNFIINKMGNANDNAALLYKLLAQTLSEP